MSCLYELKDIVKTYRSGPQALTVLNRLSLKIEKGQALCVTGPSGSGKSTLLHIIGALDRPTSGQVLYQGRDLANFSDQQLAFLRRSQIGFVFQFHHLMSEFSALENIMMPGHLSARPKKEVKERAMFLMKTLGLEQRAGHYPSELSGGEQQRTAIARALMNEPEALLADEPVGSLDRENASRIRELFFSLREEFQLTLIVVSHDPLFSEFFPRILKLEDGKIQDINAPQ